MPKRMVIILTKVLIGPWSVYMSETDKNLWGPINATLISNIELSDVFRYVISSTRLLFKERKHKHQQDVNIVPSPKY